jgi:hypothetical protein
MGLSSQSPGLRSSDAPPPKLGMVNSSSPALSRPSEVCSTVNEWSDEVRCSVDDESCRVELEDSFWLDACCELVCPQPDDALLFSSLPNLDPKSDIVNPTLLPLFPVEELALLWIGCFEDQSSQVLVALELVFSSSRTECSGSVRSGGFGCSSFLRCSSSTSEDLRSCSSFASGFFTRR